MASQRHIKLWLLAMESMGELPKFYLSLEEKLTDAKETAKTHQAQLDPFVVYPHGVGTPCECEDCRMVRNAVKNGYDVKTDGDAV